MAYVSLGATDPLAPIRSGTSVLKRGSKGDAVREVQRILVSDGLLAAADVDGDFGPKTEGAVKTFQTRSAVRVDGIVGKETMAALDAASVVNAPAVAAAAIDPKKRTPVLTRQQAIAAAKEKAKQEALNKVNVQRRKGVADAQKGVYAAPASTAPPDFDTMNYQAGWLSTGKPLPPGVVHIGPGGVPVAGGAGSAADTAGGGGGGDKQKMIAIGVLGAAAVVALLILKK